MTDFSNCTFSSDWIGTNLCQATLHRGSKGMHLCSCGPIMCLFYSSTFVRKHQNALLFYLYFRVCSMWSMHPDVSIMTLYLFAGTSTPPGISATAVPSIAAPIGVNGFSALPPQSNGQPTSEPIYTNGIHPYPGELIKVFIKETSDTSITSTVMRLLLWPWHLR